MLYYEIIYGGAKWSLLLYKQIRMSWLYIWLEIMDFQCQCGRMFSRKDNLHRHIITSCILNKILCDKKLKSGPSSRTEKCNKRIPSNNNEHKSRRYYNGSSHNKNNDVKCIPKTRKNDDSSETMSSESEYLVSVSDSSVSVSDSSEDICYLKR